MENSDLLKELKEYNIINEENNNIVSIFFKNDLLEKMYKNNYNFYLNNNNDIIITKNGLVEDSLVINNKELLRNAKFVYLVDEKSNKAVVLKMKEKNLDKNLNKYVTLK